MALEQAIAPITDFDIAEAPAATPPRAAATTARTGRDETRVALLSAPILPTMFRLALPTVTVLLAQLTYQQTLLNRVQAQAARFTDTAALFQALGGGWWNRTPGPEEQARRLRCRPPTRDDRVAQEVKTQQ